MKVLHHHCSTDTEKGCDCGAAEANAYIGYLHEKVSTLEAENSTLRAAIEGYHRELTTPTITCPRCGMTSANSNDIREGYCGNCHDWTTPR